jgi:hypothetical protein
MARRRIWLGLLVPALIVAAGAAGFLVWSDRYAPCARPVAYRVETVDPRFGVSAEDVREALRQAETVWRRSLGRDLFTESPTARLAVTFVYDERQQTTQTAQRLRRSMRDTGASHAAIGKSHAAWRATYEARARDYADGHAAYQRRAQAYQEKVQQWNARGGAPRDAREELEAERAQLDATRRQLEADRAALDELAATVKSLTEQGNAVAEAHNRDVGTFNALYGAPREFHKGEFNGREITVFEFHDARDLALLLAHELGHALGLGHVEDPAAIMNAMAGGQAVDPIAATPADVAALTTLCRGARSVLSFRR